MRAKIIPLELLLLLLLLLLLVNAARGTRDEETGSRSIAEEESITAELSKLGNNTRGREFRYPWERHLTKVGSFFAPAAMDFTVWREEEAKMDGHFKSVGDNEGSRRRKRQRLWVEAGEKVDQSDEFLKMHALIVRDENIPSCGDKADKYSRTRYFMCSGVVLSENRVLTSGSCINRARIYEYHIRAELGVLIGALDTYSYVIKIEDYKIHPEYVPDPASINHAANNVAVLMLACSIPKESLMVPTLPTNLYNDIGHMCCPNKCKLLTVVENIKNELTIQSMDTNYLPAPEHDKSLSGMRDFFKKYFTNKLMNETEIQAKRSISWSKNIEQIKEDDLLNSDTEGSATPSDAASDVTLTDVVTETSITSTEKINVTQEKIKGTTSSDMTSDVAPTDVVTETSTTSTEKIKVIQEDTRSTTDMPIITTIITEDSSTKEVDVQNLTEKAIDPQDLTTKKLDDTKDPIIETEYEPITHSASAEEELLNIQNTDSEETTDQTTTSPPPPQVTDTTEPPPPPQVTDTTEPPPPPQVTDTTEPPPPPQDTDTTEPPPPPPQVTDTTEPPPPPQVTDTTEPPPPPQDTDTTEPPPPPPPQVTDTTEPPPEITKYSFNGYQGSGIEDPIDWNDINRSLKYDNMTEENRVRLRSLIKHSMSDLMSKILDTMTQHITNIENTFQNISRVLNKNISSNNATEVVLGYVANAILKDSLQELNITTFEFSNVTVKPGDDVIRKYVYCPPLGSPIMANNTLVGLVAYTCDDLQRWVEWQYVDISRNIDFIQGSMESD